MLHFHKERMREINTIIRELWRQIYRGNDIDYIEIKTDVPEHSSKFCVLLLLYYNYKRITSGVMSVCYMSPPNNL